MAVPSGGRERITQYLPQNGPAVVDHSGKGLPDYAMPARRFFLDKVRASETTVNRLFHEATGQFIYRAEKPRQNLYSMDPVELDQYLREQLDPIYSVINGSLDESKPGAKGFNKHDTPHIDRVTYGIWALLEQVSELGMPMDIDDFRDTIIASRIHDLGNLLTRADHSAIGVDIALLAIPWLGERPERLEKVREMVYYHDEPRIREAVSEYEAQLLGVGRRFTADDTVTFFQEKFGAISPGLLAIIMADKTDITRDRFSLKAAQNADPDDCLLDQHLMLNFFLHTVPFQEGMTQKENRGKLLFPHRRESGFSEDGEVFSWKVFLNRRMDPGEQKFFKSLARHAQEGEKGVRAHIPQDLYDQYQAGVPVLASIESRLWRTYWDRIRFTVIAAFAIHPKLQTFSFELCDPVEPFLQSGTHKIEIFERGNLDANFKRLEQMYFPKKEERPSRRRAY